MSMVPGHIDRCRAAAGGSPPGCHDRQPKVADSPPRSALHAALALTRRGIAVIPLRSRSKVPALPWQEYQDRRPSDSEVRRWWKRSRGVAIVTGSVSGVIVVDVDPRNGGSVEALEELVGPLPPGPVVASGRGDGGRHFWLRHPGGFVPSRSIAPGIDVLGDGHLAIVPPSIHPEGGAYRWEVGPDAPLPEAPERLLDLVVPDERSTGGHAVRPAVVGSGRRRGAACASASQRSEFTELWNALGVALSSGDRHTAVPSTPTTTSRRATSTPKGVGGSASGAERKAASAPCASG